MVFVGKQQLQRMFAGRQRDVGLRLTSAEVQVMRIVRHRLIKRRQIGVDQQMVMS